MRDNSIRMAVGLIGTIALVGCSNSSGAILGGGLGGNQNCSSTGPTYKIGYEGPLTGDSKQFGINMLNGVHLAVAQANASKKLCFQLEVAPSDDAGSTAMAPAAAANLMQDSSVIGVIGPAFSGAAAAVGKPYAAAGMPLISPSATDGSLTQQGFTTFHRIVPTDSVEGRATADYLAAKFKKVVVIDDQSTYGAGVAQVVATELRAKGVGIIQQSIAPTTDYSAIATKVASSGAQAMYYGGFDAQAGLLAKALEAASYKGFRMSGNAGKSATFTSTAGVAGNGYHFACGCLDANTAPSAAVFKKAYIGKFHTPPSSYSPEAYDATNAMISAMNAAHGEGALTRASVEVAVKDLNFSGITSQIKFTPTGDVQQATVNLYEQRKGKIVLLGDIKEEH
ncbi:branched-chain amino acid ABC transporter substrate-binding protein [Streptomyces asiaticus]|uniref:branched-chain amino acid ABC transporter substrate-binding protein n=1 Tax=Streptomyces asiaticus TaxID=114695 RepID=UPI003D723C9D